MSFTRDTYCKVTELFDLPMCMNIMQVFGYDCLFTDSFQEKNRKEHEDDNYIKFSRGSSELQRALLVTKYFIEEHRKINNYYHYVIKRK